MDVSGILKKRGGGNPNHTNAKLSTNYTRNESNQAVYLICFSLYDFASPTTLGEGSKSD